jgi:hypothetical protein
MKSKQLLSLVAMFSFCLAINGPAVAEKTILIGCPLPLTGP